MELIKMEDIEATKTRIKEIDEILQDDYKEHLESLLDVKLLLWLTLNIGQIIIAYPSMIGT
jgi:hypothetical protein